MGLFHDSNNLWKNKTTVSRLKTQNRIIIISFNLGSMVLQPSNPIDSPTVILYSYCDLEELLGPSAPCCSENQRELGHTVSSSLNTLVLFRLTNNFCQSDVKRWSPSHHRIVSFRMSHIHVTLLKWSQIQDFHLTSDLTTPHLSPCVEYCGLQKAGSYRSLEYVNNCRVLSNLIYCLNLRAQGNIEISHTSARVRNTEQRV